MALRRLGRVRAFIGLTWTLRHIPLWLVREPDSPEARHRARHFFSEIAECFGIRTEVKGRISPEPATLFIMNHISWADIPVIMATLDADFVAKSDMLGWPVIGPLARRLNPVFIARDQLHRSRDQVDAIKARLSAGRSVILCAEGTTSDGASILPFRTSLFAAASAARLIQPLLIRYISLGGCPLPLERQREVAWIDDDELLAGAARMARQETLAHLEFLEPIVPISVDRKQLSASIRAQMLVTYAAALNLPR